MKTKEDNMAKDYLIKDYHEKIDGKDVIRTIEIIDEKEIIKILTDVYGREVDVE